MSGTSSNALHARLDRGSSKSKRRDVAQTRRLDADSLTAILEKQAVDTIVAVVKSGASFQIGATQDGSSWKIRVWEHGESYDWYVTDAGTLQDALDDIDKGWA